MCNFYIILILKRVKESSLLSKKVSFNEKETKSKMENSTHTYLRTQTLYFSSFKVGFSPSKQNPLIGFNENPLREGYTVFHEIQIEDHFIKHETLS